jgi:hypothetical protein
MKTFIIINAAVMSLVACTLCVYSDSQQELGLPTNDRTGASGTEIPFPEMVEHFNNEPVDLQGSAARGAPKN